MRSWDKYSVGIVIGLILPALFGLLYIHHYNLWYSIAQFGWNMKPVLGKLLYVSIFPNLAFIFVFYTLDAWKVSKGLLIGAFPYLLTAIAFTI